MTITETIARAIGLATIHGSTLPPAESLRHQAEAAITALTEAGYAIVPREPTGGMIEAMVAAWSNPHDIYRAMISAAPLDTKEGE